MLTPEEFALSLRMAAARTRSEELTLEVEEGLQHVAQDARDMIGTERPEWAPLAESTMKGFTTEGGHHFPGKEELGFVNQRSPTDPLLRTGVLESSISAQASRNGLTIKGVVGSDDKIAIYQELGTIDSRHPIPARPFLASALIQNEHVMGEHLVQFLTRVLTNKE